MKTFHINLFLCVNFVVVVFAYYKKCYDEFSVCLIANTDDSTVQSKYKLSSLSAHNWCKEKSSSLAIITNEMVQSAITDFINDSSAKLDSDIITYGYRFNQSTWGWTDNTGADISVISSYYGYGFVIQTVSDRLYISHDRLATSKRKFICSCLSYNSNCPDDHQLLGMSCYKIHYQNVTWFDARNICLKEEGSDLAIFENGNLSLTLEERRRDEYWIGLWRERWIWRNDRSSVDLKYSSWEDEKPNSTGGDCLCVRERTGKWTECDCSQQYRFICIQDYASDSASTMIASTTTMTTTATNMTTTVTKPITIATKMTSTVTKTTTITTNMTTTVTKPTTRATKMTTTRTKPTKATTKSTTTVTKPTTTTTKPTTKTTKMTTTAAKRRKTTQSTTTTISTAGDSSSQFQSTSTQKLNDDSEHSSGMLLGLGIGSACLLILIIVIAVACFIKNRRSRYGDVGPRNGNSQPPTMHNDEAPNTVYAVVIPHANEPVRSPSGKTSNQTVYAELDLEPKRKVAQRASEPVRPASEKASNQAVYAEVGLAPKGNRGTTHERAVPESEYANSSLVDSVYANSAQTKV